MRSPRRTGGWLALAALLLTLTGCAPAINVTPSPPPSATPVPMAEPTPTTTPVPSPSPTEEPDPIAAQLAEMTTAEKVGQLLIAGVRGLEAGADAVYAIQSVQVGGVILFGGNVDSCGQAAALVNQLRALNAGQPPLFIAADQEGGSVSRMPAEVDKLPAAYTIGQEGDPARCYALGQALAAQCSALGIGLDFAPVADVWSNPENTVIGRRAFSADGDEAALLVPQVVAGLADSGVIPVVKHFPGHGDTTADSHRALPVVSKSLEELEELELKPFRTAIQAGAPAVMVGHLLMEALDDTLPASLSPRVVDGLLRQELGFDGVIFTDDLTMQAITQQWDIGEAVVLAVEAGCDVVLVCRGQENLQLAYQALLTAVTEGRITQARLDESVGRILALKTDFALTNDPVSTPDVATLNQQLAQLLP